MNPENIEVGDEVIWTYNGFDSLAKYGIVKHIREDGYVHILQNGGSRNLVPIRKLKKMSK